jgi:DNA-binding response OmpR family regulator
MSQLTSPQIMIVEDDPDIAQLLGRIFHIGGYTTAWAPDGLQALARLEDEPPDLMTLDVNMPHLSGVEVLTQIRATPVGRELPVLVLTSREELPQQVYTQASKVMRKPFDLATLLAAVRDLLEAPATHARAIGE